MTRLTQASKRKPLGPDVLDGRTWDRNRREADSLESILADCLPLLQGVLGGSEGGSDPLSTTGFHSALGRIRDMVRGSEELRSLAARLLSELVDE